MLVLHLSHSPFVAGFVAFVSISPSVIVYIPAGALVDRWNPSWVMLVSECGRGIAIVSIVVAVAFFHPNVYLLIPAMLAEEILEIFSTLAERRYISGVTGRGRATYAQACVEARAHAVVLMGRPVGPFLFAIKPIAPFIADAVSFIISVASLFWIKCKHVTFSSPAGLSGRRLRSDIVDAVSWLHGDGYARKTVVLMASTTLIAQALIMVFLSEAYAHGISSFAIGAVLAASGAGGALGSIAARQLLDWTRNHRSHWLRIQMCSWSFALAFLALSGGQSIPWIAGAMIVLGFTGAVGNVEFGAYLTREVDERMLARVTSIGQLMAIGACALGPVIGGSVIQQYGVQKAILLLLLMAVALMATSLSVPDPASCGCPQSLRPAEWPVLAELPSRDPGVRCEGAVPVAAQRVDRHRSLPAGGRRGLAHHGEGTGQRH
jgi:MFS family permease